MAGAGRPAIILSLLALTLLRATSLRAAHPDPGEALERALRSESPGGLERAAAGRYRVSAGAGDEFGPGLAARLASSLEGFERAYLDMWDGHLPPPASAASPVDVYVFSRPESLRAAMTGLGVARPSFKAGGAHFRERGVLAAARESRLERVLVSGLVHEAAHLLNGEIFGQAATPWFNEGLAQYCQYSRIGPGSAFELGALDPGSALRVLEGGHEVLYQFVPRRSLSYLLGQFMRDPGLSLGSLIEVTSPDRFYGEGAQLRYAQSWTLIHLLAEGKVRRLGPLRPYLYRYARLERRGRGGRDALLAAVPLSLEDLDSAWYRHVKKLR